LYFYVFSWKKNKGGSGFLGQHIVRLIEERDPTVKEIRILDLQPYKNRLSKYHEQQKEKKEISGISEKENKKRNNF
jgi:nucleoside-diphosphate-sugar epimerase